MPRRLLITCLAVLLVAVPAWLALVRWLQGDSASPAARYEQWHSRHVAEVASYQAFLDRDGVGAIVPMAQLLRLGRRWRQCGGDEFAVPPSDRWPGIVPTLRLYSDLRLHALIGAAQAASGYRGDAFNRCEGGSRASRHLGNQAIDLDLDHAMSPDETVELCQAWRRIGPRSGWGLGFYSTTQIHIDTAGFRTWGPDYHSSSSPCGGNR